ncbi:MAG TPA: hypothetical protein VNN72_04675 [Polyangiaceae bacterium]|nr:hypothetical protein [Polyangiaceae bacterium]
MFEIVPEPEFRSWFESLAEPLAEEVATALEVVAHAAETLDPPGVSRALLWFDGTGTGASGVGSAGAYARRFHLEHSANGLRAVLAWQHELLACLGSPAFRRRLEKLPHASAADALQTVESLRAELRAWQKEVVLGLGAGRVSIDLIERRRAAIMREFSGVLELLGLRAGEFIALSNALRELTITRVNPPLRVLFGIDATAKRLVALLGEPLDRAYYGDSVRRVEARWARYQERAVRARDGAA